MNTKHHHIWLNLQFEHVVGHLSSHLGWQSLSKISKMTTMAVPFNIETCNEHQTPPLKHVVRHLGSHQPLTKISKMTAIVPPFNLEACNKHQTPQCLGQSSKHVISLLGSHLRWKPLPKISKLTTMATCWCLVFIASLYIEWWSHGGQFWDFC